MFYCYHLISSPLCAVIIVSLSPVQAGKPRPVWLAQASGEKDTRFSQKWEGHWLCVFLRGPCTWWNCRSSLRICPPSALWPVHTTAPRNWEGQGSLSLPHLCSRPVSQDVAHSLMFSNYTIRKSGILLNVALDCQQGWKSASFLLSFATLSAVPYVD